MKRFQRLVVWLVCAGVILSPLDIGRGMRLSTGGAPAVLTLLGSDLHGTVLELSIPSFSVQEDRIGTTDIQRISVPGLIQTDEPGMPELPALGKLIAVPAGVQVSLNILIDQKQPLTGSYVLPLGAEPNPLTGENQPGSYQEPIPAANAGPELLSQGYYPAEPVRIAEEVWLRDQRMVRVAFAPFQYDSASGQLIWHRLLRVEVTYSGQAIAESRSKDDDPFFEPVYRQSVFNYESGIAFRSKAPSSLAPPVCDSGPGTNTRYRIVVDHPGLYRLTYSDLQAAGMPVDQINPQYLQLTNQGRDVAILVKGEVDGKFDPWDEILFYGEAFRGDVMAATYASEDDSWLSFNGWQAQLTPEYFERYTDENVYWLWVQNTAGDRMPPPVPGVPGTGTVPQVFTDTVRAEQSHRYWSFHFTNQDPWVWDDMTVTSMATHTYTTTLTGLATGAYTATLQGEMLSSVSSSVNPDHHTWFTFNAASQRFADQFWDGAIRQPFSAQVPQSLLNEGTNQLHLTVEKMPALIADRITFDWFSIVYARLFQAVNDQLTFERDEAGQSWEYHISNFSTSDIQVLDITNPLIPQPVDINTVNVSQQPIRQNSPGNTSAFTLKFQASHPGMTRYLALASAAIQTPKSISAYSPPDLYAVSNGADYIIIAASEFIASSQSLADYRAEQGLRTMVVDIQDIYNLFNFGIYHPLAIKSFLAYAYQCWQFPSPAYALLVGDGHWNFKGYSGNTQNGGYAYVESTIYMPPYMAWVDPEMGETDSSSLLATVSGLDILPDLSIARLPVNSVSQLQAAISKIMAYESSTGKPWQQRMLFVADNPDTAGNFYDLSDAVISQSVPPNISIDRVYLSSPPIYTGPQAAYEITATLNLTGSLFMNYIGHGAINLWAAEGMLATTGDPALLNSPQANHIVTMHNASQLPVMISMDCLDGYWNYAVEQWTSLAEEMVRAPGKGAVAAYSPTGLGVASGHDILNRAFYSAVFEGGMQELGPATISSKANLLATGMHKDLVDTFTIFGDPALRLLTTVAPAHAYLNGTWGKQANYNLRLINTGDYTGTPVADTFTLSAHGSSWPVAFSSNNLTLLPGEAANIQVTISLPKTPPPVLTDSVEIAVTSARLGKTIAFSTLVTSGGQYLYLPVSNVP